jgi:hypothetical protein
MMWVYFNIFEIFMVIRKSLELLRANETFSQQVKLVKKGLVDIFPFGCFFVAWLFIFTLIYLIEGASLFDVNKVTEYDNINHAVAMFIQTLRNSLGDIYAPRYDFWLRIKDDPDRVKLTWT